jgi:hypothetical protein
MATTRLIKRHISVGKSKTQSMKDSFDYGQNPDKTQGGELVAAYMCDPQSADAEFALSQGKIAAKLSDEMKMRSGRTTIGEIVRGNYTPSDE